MTARAVPSPTPAPPAPEDRTAYTEDELRELASEMRDWLTMDSYTPGWKVQRAARVLELAARGDLEVIRCTCELYGPATCPTCG